MGQIKKLLEAGGFKLEEVKFNIRDFFTCAIVVAKKIKEIK